MGVTFFPLWSVFGAALFGSGYPFELEVLFRYKGEEKSLESGSPVYFLGDLED